jgi:hypothetical protein
MPQNSIEKHPNSYKATLAHILLELDATPFTDKERRNYLYDKAIEAEYALAARGKNRVGRPRGAQAAAKRKAKESSVANNPGAAMFSKNLHNTQ